MALNAAMIPPDASDDELERFVQALKSDQAQPQAEESESRAPRPPGADD